MKKRERASDNRAPSVGIDLSIPIPRKESADSERIDVIIVVAHSSLAIENKEGRIKKAIDTLAKENINIRALSISDTTKYGILRLIVSDNAND